MGLQARSVEEIFSKLVDRSCTTDCTPGFRACFSLILWPDAIEISYKMGGFGGKLHERRTLWNMRGSRTQPLGMKMFK